MGLKSSNCGWGRTSNVVEKVCVGYGKLVEHEGNERVK